MPSTPTAHPESLKGREGPDAWRKDQVLSHSNQRLATNETKTGRRRKPMPVQRTPADGSNPRLEMAHRIGAFYPAPIGATAAGEAVAG
jgi:hypothetical protein